ncbi:response regulator transcription factor [Streptomyces sp. NPDC047974]|uniref:response regulator transcription factor n=1 Tax=Streptomyces sp. NPDC047974 TaxID=3154343 RepID=UPI00340053C6
MPVALIGDVASTEWRAAPLPPGVSGFLPEGADPRALAHAVHTLAAGAAVLPLEMLWCSALPGVVAAAPQGLLALREKEVLVLIGSGLTNHQIARRLGLTAATVKAYVSGIYAKIGAGNRVQAALFAHGIAGSTM